MNYLNNKYSKLYFKLVSQADNIEYTEIHHIVPRSLGGTNESGNLVKISPRKHFLCHYLLCKMFPNKTKEWYSMNNAFMLMKAESNKQVRYFNSHLYEKMRVNFSETMSICQSGSNNSQYGTRWIYNKQLKQNKKIKHNEKIPEGWFPGRSLFKEPIPKFTKLPIDYFLTLKLYQNFLSGEQLRSLCKDLNISHVALYKRFERMLKLHSN